MTPLPPPRKGHFFLYFPHSPRPRSFSLTPLHNSLSPQHFTTLMSLLLSYLHVLTETNIHQSSTARDGSHLPINPTSKVYVADINMQILNSVYAGWKYSSAQSGITFHVMESAVLITSLTYDNHPVVQYS